MLPLLKANSACINFQQETVAYLPSLLNNGFVKTSNKSCLLLVCVHINCHLLTTVKTKYPACPGSPVFQVANESSFKAAGRYYCVCYLKFSVGFWIQTEAHRGVQITHVVPNK